MNPIQDLALIAHLEEVREQAKETLKENYKPEVLLYMAVLIGLMKKHDLDLHEVYKLATTIYEAEEEKITIVKCAYLEIHNFLINE